MIANRLIPRSLGALAALLLLLAPALAPTAVADHCHEDCDAGSNAWFGGFESGGLTLQTAAGSATIPVWRGSAEHVAISMTGVVEVEVNYRCVEMYHFFVVKQDLVNGPVVVYDAWMPKACGSGVDVHQVPIGLDAGQYEFFLEWVGCDGTAGRDYRELVIFDPPLPSVGL